MGEYSAAAAACRRSREEKEEGGGIVLAPRLIRTSRQAGAAAAASCSCRNIGSLLSLQTLCILLLFLVLPAFCQTDDADPDQAANSGSYPKEANTIGINYGRIADNLPTPEEVVVLIQSMKIGRVKLFDSDPTVLTALAHTGLQVISALPNEDIAAVAASNATAELWVQENVLAYYPATDITTIHVGNELWANPGFQPLWDQLMPCIWNIHASLTNHNLSQTIKISTAVALSALGSSYPPSAGAFDEDIAVPYVEPLLHFLATTYSYFYINAYPYFAWASDSGQIPLQYALFESPAVGVLDTGLKYYNMLDAQLDAVNAAMTRLGYGHVRLAISETGWPTSGDPNQLGCNIANAQNYNRRLVDKMLSTSSVGTPSRPGVFIPTFIFALFNEDLKPGPGTERHWGMLYPNGTNVYSIDMTGQQSVGRSGGGGGSSPAATNLPNSNNDPVQPDSSGEASAPGFEIPFDMSSAAGSLLLGSSSSPSSYSSSSRSFQKKTLLTMLNLSRSTTSSSNLPLMIICNQLLIKFPFLLLTITFLTSLSLISLSL
jgi:exo-beta-1,3-glucanase (GH17 family)